MGISGDRTFCRRRSHLRDILRSKKTLDENDVDCTEMDHELEVLEETREEGFVRAQTVGERRDELNYQLQKIEFEEKQQKEKKQKAAKEMKMIKQLEEDFQAAKLDHRKKTKEYHERFHWVWGALMKSMPKFAIPARKSSDMRRYTVKFRNFAILSRGELSRV